MFFSLKDNVSYEETGTKYKRDREYAGLWVSGDSFCRFTAVYAEQAGDDRKCKIFVFPEYYAGAGGFCGAGISKAVIELFLKENLIYESRHYHNIVFKGNDKNGVTRFASMRGVFDKQGKPFKCDVEGNDKNYGFNVVNVNSTELVVFEAAIDLMSYVDIFADHESNKLALGMLADAPLATFLREHPQISFIRFCLDGDSPGRKAAAELMGKYYGLGYEVEDCPPPAGYKDYNEWLVATKLNLADQKKEQMTIAGQCH